MRQCPFCSFELEPNKEVCPNCKIDNSFYSYYQNQALELIELAKDQFDKPSNAIELLKHSLILDRKNILPLKLLGLLFTSEGRYDIAKYYLDEYNKKSDGDSEAEDLTALIKHWEKELNRYSSVTF